MSDDLGSELSAKSGVVEYEFDVGRRRFWKQVSSAEWIELSEAAMRRELGKVGLASKVDAASGAKISPLDDRLREVEQTRRVVEARRIAGWHAGVHVMGGDRVLVPAALRLVERKEGKFPLIAAFLESLLDGDERDWSADEKTETFTRCDQRDRWLAWAQDWMLSLYSGRPSSGLVLCVAGLPNCGKSRLLALEKAMAGGKVGKCYDWMIGREDFNKELFEASLLAVDDENANTSREARRELGAKFKKIVANEDVKLRGMHSDGFVVTPCWRVHVNTNLEEGALLVLPPLTDDIKDKELMLKGYARARPGAIGMETREKIEARYPALAEWWRTAIEEGALREADISRCWPMPMPTGTRVEQEHFWDRIMAELPAFVFWLTKKYEAPSQVVDSRFCVGHWQHPEIVNALQEFEPHVNLWRMIERSGVVWRVCLQAPCADEPDGRYEERNEWTGTASELRELLTDEHNRLSRHDRDSVAGESWLGQRLREAGAHWGQGVVEFKRSGQARRWILRRKPEVTG